ncbi:hypothetical protein OA796_22300 [Citrobacter freundii]|nr:hypothetical protein [Citrobacter freundii]MDN4264142.1 hypothetical protein [Citrobacter freundii]
MADAVKVIDGSISAFDADPQRNPVLAYADSYRDMAKRGVESIPVWSVITDLERNIAPLYATPPSPVVPDDVLDALQKVARIRLDLNDFDGDRRGIADCLGNAEEALIEVVNRSAAMLQGAEPVSEHDELPLDYLQGHKDGLAWAAQLAEANHPQTGDWLYDDPVALAAAIRKGPDMPEFKSVSVDGDDNYQQNNYTASAKQMLGTMAEFAYRAGRESAALAGNSPVIPDGWQLVPKEPTEAMNKAGWAAMNEHDAINPTYRAMLAAAPQQENV